MPTHLCHVFITTRTSPYPFQYIFFKSNINNLHLHGDVYDARKSDEFYGVSVGVNQLRVAYLSCDDGDDVFHVDVNYQD